MSDARFRAAIDAMNKAREKDGIILDGKKYSMVKDRVEIFREQFGMECGIETEVHWPMGSDIVVVKARIVHIQSGNTLGSGHAMAYYGTSEMYTNSIVEAVETAAIGRALASFGFHGGEYASDKEMEKVQNTRKQSPEREETIEEFKAEVAKHFPPSVNQYTFKIPEGNKPGDINLIYEEIDRIDNVNELTAYWKALEEPMQWFHKEDLAEIKATFKARTHQLKA